MHTKLPRYRLSDTERLDWLRLIRTENVGPITFFRLLERFGSAAAAIAALPDLARRGGRSKPLSVFSRAQAEREIATNTRHGARLIAACEPDYPEMLAAIDDPPPLLSLRGQGHLLRQRAVAVVGSRNASLNGRRFAEKLAAELGQAGLLIVSGFARGIDTAAHAGALATGTAAVMAGGIDVIYPEENTQLYHSLCEQGVVVAETACGTTPQARHFPRRNRVISGMALGVVVVEGTAHSGSLITARLAGEQGREVFAVPGSPMDPRCQGPNALIRQGATLVQSAADILEALPQTLSPPLHEDTAALFVNVPPPALDEAALDLARPQIEENLSPTPVGIDDLIRALGLPPAVVAAILLEMELAGRLQRLPGHQVCLV